MSGSAFVACLDAAFYPGSTPVWDNVRYRMTLLQYIRRTDRVLDLGAGRGRVPEMNFRGIAAHVTGVDLEPSVADNPYLDEAVILDASSATLPLADASYDVVFTSNVLEHLEDPSTLFREVARVLKPGGVFINKTPNRFHYVALVASLTPQRFHEWINTRRGRPAHDTFQTHYRSNSARAIRRLAHASALDVVTLEAWEGPPNYLRVFPPLYPLGIVYERLVNIADRFAVLRAVLVAVLRKAA